VRLKKFDWYRINYKYMRRSASEKMEIIRIVQDSELGVKRTLEELGISRSTFYTWYGRFLQEGFEGLKPKETKRKSFWNKIPEKGTPTGCRNSPSKKQNFRPGN